MSNGFFQREFENTDITLVTPNSAEQEKIYSNLCKYLAATLGSDYEVIVHSVDNAHVVAIENGYISGRNLDSPITNLAISLIKSGYYKDHDFKVHYKAKTKTQR
jgi:predicted transcriptional regulator YheO